MHHWYLEFRQKKLKIVLTALIKTKIIMITGIILLSFNSNAQSYPDLIELKGFSIKTYFSPGNEEKTRVIVARCERTIDYIGKLVGFTPKIRLFILNPEHWKKYATFPVYGMAHYADNDRLIIASQENDFWKSLIPPLDQIPKDLADKFRLIYTNNDGTLSLSGFFDLLTLHELGHGFHEQAGLTMHRLWMQELFSNLMLHTYIAENEPELLPVLEVLPESFVSCGTIGYKFTTLADFEKMYSNMDLKNFGWYQCKLHIAAKNIYNSGGKKVFIKLWNALKENKEEMSDAQFAEFLTNKVGSEIAQVQSDW
jgi:hypothetical protein